LRTTTLAAFFSLALVLPCFANDDWPQFRGPTQQGHSDSSGVPLKWSETQGVVLKTPIPGEGWSSPVVMGDQVWMTTATGGGKSLRAVCVDRNNGRIVHDVEVFALSKLDPKNEFNSYASPTPVLARCRSRRMRPKRSRGSSRGRGFRVQPKWLPIWRISSVRRRSRATRRRSSEAQVSGRVSATRALSAGV